jgi:acyl-CoA thioester hydrolase
MGITVKHTEERELYRSVAQDLERRGVPAVEAWKGREAQRFADKARACLAESLPVYRGLRGNGDLDGIVAVWMTDALDLLEGFRMAVAPDAVAPFKMLCRALNDAAISAGEAMQRRLDAYGHVNNAIYYAMMDQVVTVYIVEAGVIAMGTSPSIGLCVASACDFHQSLEFPEVVDARLRVGRIGDKSVRYEIALFKAGIDAPASTGHFVHVYVDRHNRAPVSLTSQQRAALEPLLSA